VRVAIFSAFAIVGISLLVTFLQGYGDTSKQVPGWWWWLGGPGITSMFLAFLVAVPGRVWVWTWRFIAKKQPISTWRAIFAWKQRVDQRISLLETIIKPMGTSATQVQEWRQGLDNEVERLRKDVGRLEGNLSETLESQQSSRPALERFQAWLRTQEREEQDRS